MDACSPSKVLTFSWKEDECKPLGPDDCDYRSLAALAGTEKAAAALAKQGLHSSIFQLNIGAFCGRRCV